MGKPLAVYAFMRGGRIYTVQRLVDKESPPYRTGFRFRAYCDGDPCGFFKTKKAFEEFISREPDLPPRGPNADAVSRAVTWSQYEGKVILQKLADQQNKEGTCPRQ